MGNLITQQRGGLRKFLAIRGLLIAVSLLNIRAPNADEGVITDQVATSAPAVTAGEYRIEGYLEGGLSVNPASPANRDNFGQLTTDLANRLILNQASIVAEKTINPAADYSVGFKLQGMYGSDARVTHYLGVADYTLKARNQLDLVEGNVTLHTPWVGAAGMDLKIGFYPTPLGVEVIDPGGNVFYSHSYLFNFGLPLKHTGILTTTHADSKVDIYAGIDTGANTTFGRSGDNNGALAYIAGLGLNGLLGGKTSVVALAHIGAEDPRGSPGIDVNRALRYYNDIAISTKASSRLTLVTELNYVRDDGFKARGYGADQYAVYTLSERLNAGVRAEVWRDANGFFVAAFPGNFDMVDMERGKPSGMLSGSPATYGEITFGVTYKPSVMAPPLSIMLRPELRYDRVLSAGAEPYDAMTARGQFTVAVDLIAKY